MSPQDLVVIRARHIDYLPADVSTTFTNGCSGVIGAGQSTTLLMAQMNSIGCLPLHEDDVYGGHHFAYGATGAPRTALGRTCCEAGCPEGDDSCYKEKACWPVLDPCPTGGISKDLDMYIQEISNCRSADRKKVRLEWDGADHKWHGSVTLRGGTVNFTFECQAGFPSDPGKFLLSWSGCDTGSISGGASCESPLVVNFGNVTLTHCCGCPEAGSTGTTSDAAEINPIVVGNCKMIYWARHIDYVGDGIPVVAKEFNCYNPQLHECPGMTCPLVGTVTAVDGQCSCMAGTFDLNNFGGTYQGAVGCVDIVTATIVPNACSNPPTVTVSITFQCGATNIGFGSTTILCTELEDLDVTIPITMSDADFFECTGNCNYQWNEMAASWSFIGSDCNENCDPCGEGPTNGSAGSTDGETRSEPCTGSYTPPCCIGRISVRIMR